MSDAWRTVATFQDTVSAAVARTFLENEGIAAVLVDEATIATDWMLATAIGGIKLQVAPLHVERAELLLAQIREAQQEAHETDRAEPADANAHAIASAEIAADLQAEREDRLPINELADKLFRTTVFGYIIWPLQLYALFLMVLIATAEGRVSPNRRWKIWLSVLLNVPILALVGVPLLFLLDSLPGTTGTPQNPVWRRHSYTQLGFSVMFPHTPGVADGSFEKFRAHDLGAQGKHRVYRIRVVHGFGAARDPIGNEELENAIAERAKRNNAVVRKTAAVEHRKIRGIEYTLDHVAHFERGRLFVKGTDLVFVTVESAIDDLAEPEPERYFQSLMWK